MVIGMSSLVKMAFRFISFKWICTHRTHSFGLLINIITHFIWKIDSENLSQLETAKKSIKNGNEWTKNWFN